MYLHQCQVIYSLILLLITSVTSRKVQAELDEETETFASRSDGRSRVVTGTFRFRRVVNDAARISSGRGTGWDIEGCYCETGTRCSCNGNRNRVRMFVRTGSKRPPMPGIPPPGMFSEGGEAEATETESERLLGPTSGGRNGCLCNVNGCFGSDCSNMNGCVCSQSACWGAACDSRIVSGSNGGGSSMLTSGNLISTATLPLTNSLQLVRNALFAGTPLAGQMINGQISSNSLAGGDCSCSNLGCSGSGCANMNGCFCVGSSCWGNSCNINSLVQASGSLLGPLGQSNQIQLPNLLNLSNGQTGSLINIPGLTGPGGILGSLLPGPFAAGGGGTSPNYGGSGIETIPGLPVKKLTATRAKRVKGKRVRGQSAIKFAASNDQMRTVRKKIRPTEETDETSKTLTYSSNETEPVLSLLQLNKQLTNEKRQLTNEKGQLTHSSVTRSDGTINFNNNSLVDQEPEESVDVFTLTDQWIQKDPFLN